MSFKHIIILLISTGLGAGCSSIPQHTNDKEASRHRDQPGLITSGKTVADDPHFVRDRLYNRYREWQGVRYRLGGSSRSGIDCSALVRIIYQTEFGLTLPRTTLSQAEFGSEIDQNELMPGDLVFFKTGWRSWHVGIYLEDRKFFHASSSKGVTLSRLDNVYWKDRYWKSIRI